MCLHSESRRNIRCSEYHLEEPPVLRLLRHIIIEYAAILYHAFRGCDFQRTRSNTTPAQVSTSTITVRLQPLVGGHDVTSSSSSQTTSKLLELLQILRTLIDEEISKSPAREKLCSARAMRKPRVCDDVLESESNG